MAKTGLLLALLFLFSQTPEKVDPSDLHRQLSYTHSKPDLKPLQLALKGYDRLKKQGKLKNHSILTLIDFTKSSAERRLWVIDLKEQKVIFQSLVAHGKNSGNVFATSFSNEHGSHQSSLGFYLTAETYTGKHGLSLYLDGMEAGINDNARARKVVMHGAKYVSEDFIETYGRLGRSFGCPSVPVASHKEIIDYIKGGSCFFIYHNSEAYLNGSKLLTETH